MGEIPGVKKLHRCVEFNPKTEKVNGLLPKEIFY